MSVARLVLSALCCLVAFEVEGAKAQDYNYAELRGNVVGMSTVTVFNANTQTVVSRDHTLLIRTDERGPQTLVVNCPDAPTALRTLCLNSETLLLGCPSVAVVTTTCLPGPDGLCTFLTARSCQGGFGKCVWAWGFNEVQATGQQRVVLDALWTRSSSACSPKSP